MRTGWAMRLGVGDGVGGDVVCCWATKIVTEEPGASTVPAFGLILNTVPGVKPSGAVSIWVFTVNPSFSSCCVASACDSPTTPGTLVPPPETKIVITLPLATLELAAGSCRTTWFCGAVELGADFSLTWKPLA